MGVRCKLCSCYAHHQRITENKQVMKNRIIYLLASALVVALIPLFLPVIGGKPLLDWHSLQIISPIPQEVDHTPRFTSEGPAKSTIVFRWKEQNNIWHFSQTPPESGTRYETVIIDAEHTHASLADQTPSNTETAQTGILSPPSLYSPAEIVKILQEAQNAQKIIQEQQERLDAALSDIHPQ